MTSSLPLLFFLFFAADFRLVRSCCEPESGNRDHYICAPDCDEFPQGWGHGVDDVAVTGGQFQNLHSFSFPSTVRVVSLRRCSFEQIDYDSFDQDRLVTVKFEAVDIGWIRPDAFTDARFRYSDDFSTGGPDDQSLQFLNCTIGRLSVNSFNMVSGLKKLSFVNTKIASVEDTGMIGEIFRQVEMEEGIIELASVTVIDVKGFPRIDRIMNVSEVHIEDLHQYALSNDLVDPEVHTHTLKSSTFNITQENLSTQNYDDVILSWSDVTVHCGDDIDWLMKDKDSIPGEMLNSLVCNGPERLVGEHVADLSEEEWEGHVPTVATSDDDSGVGFAVLLIIIMLGIILAVGVLVMIVMLYRCQRSRTESSLTVVMTDVKRRQNEELPPSYTSSASQDQFDMRDDDVTKVVPGDSDAVPTVAGVVNPVYHEEAPPYEHIK